MIHKIKVNNYCHLRVQKQIWLLMIYWDTYEVKRMVCARNVTLFTTVLQSDLVNFVHRWNVPVLKNDWFTNRSSLWTVCLRLWITENNVVNNCTNCLVHFIRPQYIISSHGNSFCIACIFFLMLAIYLHFMNHQVWHSAGSTETQTFHQIPPSCKILAFASVTKSELLFLCNATAMFL